MDPELATDDAVAALAAGDHGTAAELRAERRLLAAHPAAAREVCTVIDELLPVQDPAPPVVVQRATASGRARVYQAGRDQHVGDR